MKITDISLQVKNKDRVNISVDGTYRFSLDIRQVTDLGIKVGKEYSEAQLVELETESQFGKLYGRALEYTLMRPHSAKEVRDYLWRKTRSTKFQVPGSNEYREKPGVDPTVADRVYERLQERGYLDDEKFAKYWIENRQLAKGVSRRKLTAELRTKGVDTAIIEKVIQDSPREEISEIQKVIAKKRRRYDDEQKFTAYLLRQGFSYDTVREALEETSD